MPPSDISQEPDKYLPSFFVEVPFDNQIVRTEIKPLKKDKGYYTVNLNNIFLAHIHQVGDVWCDFLGSTNEIYQAVGKKIEEKI